jgi:hypothetical protein
MAVKKQIPLVMALCRLHNFCIGQTDDEFDVSDLLGNTLGMNDSDELHAINAGGVEVDCNTGRINELLSGGEHFDDVTASELGTIQSRSDIRAQLLKKVIDGGYHRTVESSSRQLIR